MKQSKIIYIAAKGEEKPIRFVSDGELKLQINMMLNELNLISKKITSLSFDECEVIKTEIKCS